MDIVELMRNPLVQSGRTGSYLRLVLAEAANCGMPPQIVVTLDDIAAMLGFYNPLLPAQAAHLAGPLVQWRTDPRQPVEGRVVDVEMLAHKQRALIAFGGMPLDHMAGTAEIVCATGNLIENAMPPQYYEIFRWATVDVLSILMEQPKDRVWEGKKWPPIADEEVLKPGGRLHATYQEIATHIRRQAIAVIKDDPEHSRNALRPLAEHFVASHRAHRLRCELDGDVDTVARLDEQIAVIRSIFPDLKVEHKAATPAS